MAIDALAGQDFASRDQPAPTGELRVDLEAWLAYQRHEFIRKLRDLDAEQLVTHSVPPVPLSVMGLVRHMTQMEHVWVVRGIGGGEIDLPYGEDDYSGATVASIEEDVELYRQEVERADAVIATAPALDSPGAGHGRPLSDTLIKMIHEYTLHAGQAHMLRYAALGEVKR